ncbi:unnamed protein product, partial [Prorocentrum cordatum]
GQGSSLLVLPGVSGRTSRSTRCSTRACAARPRAGPRRRAPRRPASCAGRPTTRSPERGQWWRRSCTSWPSPARAGPSGSGA